MTSSSSAVKHIVGLDNSNIEHFRDSSLKFKKIRITTHTTGKWQGTPHSDNHVTVYLLLENSANAVRVDMRTDEDDTRGQLEWRLLGHQKSGSAVRIDDYELGESVSVAEFYSTLNDWGMHRYIFADGGSGCRYWM